MLLLSNPQIFSIGSEQESLEIPEWFGSDVAVKVFKSDVTWVRSGWINQFVRSDQGELVLVRSDRLFLNNLQLISRQIPTEEFKLKIDFVSWLDDCQVWVWQVS